ncbi:alpha/beta fold hydrolase [Agrobacterium sp. LAD9]|uniref:alpha/beta fold hydrolase n=1 Tax=Agrobacterium sp. LAD9 TaxID=2055153 RepID=UPI000D1F6E35|nr:alpha/beta hydrolase [Agrobacterium sp. LAD9]
MFEATAHTYDLGNGQTLFYQAYAPTTRVPATTVVCLPGFWRNSKDFERIARVLAPSRRVVMPDLRGRGRSTRSARVEDYHFEQLITDVWALVDDLALGRVVLLGTALGAYMAIEMGYSHPERVAGIILNDAGTETAPPGSKRVNAHVDHEHWTLQEVVEKTKKLNGAFFKDFSEEDWVRFSLQAYRETEDAHYVRDFDPLTSEETARFKKDRPSLWQEYTSLKMPVAVLRGENSDYLASELAEKMALANPNTVLTTVVGRGHPLILDEPQAVDAIHNLLERADE